MPADERRRAALLGAFRDESSELVRELGRTLFALEDAAGADERARLFADVDGRLHTLKGSAGIVGLDDIAALIHELETRVLAVGRAPPDDLSPFVSGVLRVLDLVPTWTRRAGEGKAVTVSERDEALQAARAIAAHGEAAEALAGGASDRAAPDASPASRPAPAMARLAPQATRAVPDAAAASAAPTAPPTGPPPSQGADEPLAANALRVPTERLDAVLTQAEELAVGLGRLGSRRDALAAVESQLEELVTTRSVAAGTGAGERELCAGVARANQRLGASAYDLGTELERLASAAGTLLEELRALRMLPADTLFETLARPCRDFAHAHGKRVELELRGGDVRLDKSVLEGLKTPLVHILRNAIAHGIEAPHEREAAGKSPVGHIELRAESRGHRVALVVSDDGRGVDVAAVRERAAREHLLAEASATELDDASALELIFRAGFSTRDVATTAAGRGVGLAVVRDAVARLRGSVTVASEAGAGTTFTLTVPLTVAATRGLVVSVGGETYALPIAGVDRVARLRLSDVRLLHGLPSAQVEDQPLRLVPLAALLDRKEVPLAPNESGALSVVVIASGRQRLALTVDRIVGEGPVILKDLPRPLAPIAVFAGATILDDGRVAPVLDVECLVHEGLARKAGAEDDAARRRRTTRRALLVDDSATTRLLVAGELTALGYRVATACDGIEALGLLESEPVDVLVTDANMPNMDGFDLTRSVRAHARLGHLPVVLLTSADAPSDRLRGIEVGADAYVIKKDFVRETMGALLEQLQRRSATP